MLLGIGWNFGFIGATALVTDCYRPEERAKVQAANDFLVFGAIATASFSLRDPAQFERLGPASTGSFSRPFSSPSRCYLGRVSRKSSPPRRHSGDFGLQDL